MKIDINEKYIREALDNYIGDENNPSLIIGFANEKGNYSYTITTLNLSDIKDEMDIEHQNVNNYTQFAPRMTPYERCKAQVYGTGNKWAIENFEATHN